MVDFSFNYLYMLIITSEHPTNLKIDRYMHLTKSDSHNNLKKLCHAMSSPVRFEPIKSNQPDPTRPNQIRPDFEGYYTTRPDSTWPSSTQPADQTRPDQPCPIQDNTTRPYSNQSGHRQTRTTLPDTTRADPARPSTRPVNQTQSDLARPHPLQPDPTQHSRVHQTRVGVACM